MLTSMMLIIALCLALVGGVKCNLEVSKNVLAMEVGQSETFQIKIRKVNNSNEPLMLLLLPEHEDMVLVTPGHLIIEFDNATQEVQCDISVFAFKSGKSSASVITASTLPNIVCKDDAFVVLKVYNDEAVELMSHVSGWMYFLAWSCSFLPQIYLNCKNKSVVGLSFDFVLFNLLGYVMYNTFNLGMFFVPYIKDQYFVRYPKSLLPVYGNDIFFSLEGMLATIIIVTQCICYERSDQRVSLFSLIICAMSLTVLGILVLLALFKVVVWLDVLYTCSYIKLVVTVTKYIPQVYLHYKRKSTEGWSVGGAIFDFTGGILSALQMFLDGYNYSDWKTVMENPTKFGLGIISITFDVVFFIQYYSFRKRNLNSSEEVILSSFQTIYI